MRVYARRLIVLRKLIMLVVVVAVFSAGVSALEWEAIDWGQDVVLNPSTGLPSIVFYVTLEYSGSPNSYDFEGGWKAYEIVNGQQIELSISPASAFLRGEKLRIYTATSQIPIEEGKSYKATFALEDTVNNLSYERSFSYNAGGTVLPYGISLQGWDGSDDIDLSKLPDEELEELAVLHSQIKRFVESPEPQTLTAFLRGDAAARPDTAILLNGSIDDGEEVDRCTYTACGAGCCSTCIEHEEEEEEEEEEDPSEEPAPDVKIECIMYEGEHFEEDGNEYVQLKNYGDLAQDLLGWTLYNKNKRQHTFTFTESFMLEPEMSVRIYTNEEYAGEDDFFFGLEESLWTNVIQYPLSLVLIPVPPNISAPAGSPITFSVTLTLYTYFIETQGDIGSIQNELAQFEQEFSGYIYAGSESSILGGSKTLFVHELAWQVLEAASREIRNR